MLRDMRRRDGVLRIVEAEVVSLSCQDHAYMHGIGLNLGQMSMLFDVSH